MAGNLCRYTGYGGIRRALFRLCAESESHPAEPCERLERLIGLGILPDYFRTVPQRLSRLPFVKDQSNTARSLQVAGGTDLFAHEPERWSAIPLAFLSRRRSLRGLWIEDGRCFVGADTTAEEIRSSSVLREYFPSLGADFRLIAATPVRHRATLGGNLANASPIADLAVYFLAHDAVLGLKQGRQLREIALSRFFLDYKLVDLRNNEEIEWLSFELPASPTVFSFDKVSRRTYLDVAAVNSALRLEVEDSCIRRAWLSAGGVAPIPLLLGRSSRLLAGRRIDAVTVRECARLAGEEIAPIDDARGSAAYRRLLLRNIVVGHFLKLFPEAIRWEDFR